MDQPNSIYFPPPGLVSRSDALPFLADHHLPYMVPAITFWVISFIFHYIDTRGLLAAYKLHTSAEDLTKNRASRKDVVKFALVQQAAQCTLGYLTAAPERVVPHEYVIAAWARRIRYIEVLAFQCVHYILTGLTWMVNDPKGHGPGPAAALIHGTGQGHIANVSHLSHAYDSPPNLSFSAWEMNMATSVYWVMVPLLQYISAMFLADTMQYFTHRAFHVNRWLYKNIHYMHHDVFVPFAYGAYYNHPLETIPIDGILFPLCLSIAGLNNRQAAVFGAIWTFKTVVDHCGYDFPYNPCNIVCPHSVLFHDLHHQTWGLKYNFSVYGSIWDWLMGTHWSPLDENAQQKYKRGKAVAEIKAAEKKENSKASAVTAGDSTAIEI